jgi:hypothetical protein
MLGPLISCSAVSRRYLAEFKPKMGVRSNREVRSVRVFLLAVAFCPAPGAASAQSHRDLAGAWLTEWSSVPDGPAAAQTMWAPPTETALARGAFTLRFDGDSFAGGLVDRPRSGQRGRRMP